MYQFKFLRRCLHISQQFWGVRCPPLLHVICGDASVGIINRLHNIRWIWTVQVGETYGEWWLEISMDPTVRKARPDHFPVQIQSGGSQISVGAFIQFSWKALRLLETPTTQKNCARILGHPCTLNMVKRCLGQT